jgi:hypothetical protein
MTLLHEMVRASRSGTDAPVAQALVACRLDPRPGSGCPRDSEAPRERLRREGEKKSGARALATISGILEHSRILEWFGRKAAKARCSRLSGGFHERFSKARRFFVAPLVGVELELILVDHALPERDLVVDGRLEGGVISRRGMSGNREKSRLMPMATASEASRPVGKPA